MIGVIVFVVVLFAIVGFACWAGRGPETSGKAWDSSGGSMGGGFDGG